MRLHRSDDWVREEARCVIRRFARHGSRSRARIAGSWQSGACYVQRAENSCACFFLLSPCLCLSFFLSLPLPVSLPRARSTPPLPAPFAFFGRSSRKWTVAPRSHFHTSSLLFLAMMPCTTRICVGQRSVATAAVGNEQRIPAATCLSISPLRSLFHQIRLYSSF